MSATRAETYLTLPLEYANRVGGLCWSAGGDAVERWNGTTLALTEELALVLEGVFSRPPVPPFVVVLHVLHLMRSDDSFVDLDERVLRADRFPNAVLISMHYNSGPSACRGPETYYWRVDSHGLATRLQQAMCQASPAESGNRGLVRRRIRLTRNPEIPCVLLEGGYLSNSAESRQISGAAYRQKLAAGIAAAIRTQAAIGDAGTGPLPRPINAPPSRPTDAPE